MPIQILKVIRTEDVNLPNSRYTSVVDNILYMSSAINFM